MSASYFCVRREVLLLRIGRKRGNYRQWGENKRNERRRKKEERLEKGKEDQDATKRENTSMRGWLSADLSKH